MNRRMKMITTGGPDVVRVISGAAASEIGQHMNAVKHYLATGDTSRLARFQDQTINLKRFLTDPDEIDRLSNVGDLEFEDIYEDVS